MKRLFLPLLIIFCPSGLNAESPLEARLSSQIQPATTNFGSISDAEKKLIISNVASTLSKHVTFRNDGTECSYTDSREGRQHVEWMNLRINKLAVAPLSGIDKEKGITRRIQAHLVYDNCRVREPKTNSWGAWGVKGHELFPPVINFEWVGARLVVDGGMYLGQFKPGSMTTDAASARQVVANPAASTPTTTDSAPVKQPSAPSVILRAPTGNNDLPPGMMRQ